MNDIGLYKGSTGEDVKKVQLKLLALGYDLKADGVYGDDTICAIKKFQKVKNLIVDGICGEKTFNLLFNESTNNKFLSEADLVKAANELGCEINSIKTAHLVESSGKGFFDDGRPKILYERHVMRRRLLIYKINPIPYIQKYPNLVNLERGGYVGGPKEYERLTAAENIHKRAAMESCSWGAYQIMGYYYKLFDYSDVEKMVADLYINEAKHLEMFVKFIKADQRLHAALVAKKWDDFAKYYNGIGNVKVYSERLTKIYNSLL